MGEGVFWEEEVILVLLAPVDPGHQKLYSQYDE